jgi:predicted O-linked N-acetylglucosamine transferase (SPINDLY family)
MPPSLQDAVNELLTLHGLGRFAEMERRAKAVLKSFAGSPVLRELLGLALASQRRFSEALPHFERAARDLPGDAQFWDNLALCQSELKQYEPAEQSLRKSLALQPASIGTLVALGRVLHLSKRSEEASELLGRALDLAPGHPAAHYHLGEVLAGLGQIEQAEQQLRLAVAAEPNVAASHNELGRVLMRRGALRDAEASFRRAITLDRTLPFSHANLALVLGAQGRAGEAAAAAREALAVIGGIGTAVGEDNLSLLDLIASALDDAGETEDALTLFKATVAFRSEPRRAIWAIYTARRACDWDFAARLEPLACTIGEAKDAVDESAPWRLLFLAGASPLQQLTAAQRSAQRIADALPAPASANAARTGKSERIRIAYFSGDFYSHAVPHLMVGVIEQHDRARFDVIAYDFSPAAKDDYRRRFEAAFDLMVPISGMSDQEAAERIARDEVDVLIDLAGWTKRARPAVLAPRPAPVQMQWLGFPGTLGAPWIDYIVADRVLIRPQDEPHFSEKIIRLPHTYQANDDKRIAGTTQSRSAYGLPEEAIVFCSFNGAFKLTPEVFDCWLRLLQAVDRSVLWLLQPEDIAVRALVAKAASRGIDPARLIFAPMVELAEHLARLACADIALDCFPYGSHTTASDTLWAGVPLVALAGDTFASRVSASILTAAGLPELITSSLADYYNLALRLAGDPGALAGLRARVKDLRTSGPLFDTTLFTRDLERALAAAWERHCAGLASAHIVLD